MAKTEDTKAGAAAAAGPGNGESARRGDLGLWEPFRELQSLAGRFDDLVGRWPRLWTGDGPFTPLADIEETDDAWVVDVELPGVTKSDVGVELHGRSLVVTGERKEKERDGVLRRKTRVTGHFRYEVTFPGDVEGDAVTATLDDGELHVRVPKATVETPRRITVG